MEPRTRWIGWWRSRCVGCSSGPRAGCGCWSRSAGSWPDGPILAGWGKPGPATPGGSWKTSSRGFEAGAELREHAGRFGPAPARAEVADPIVAARFVRCRVAVLGDALPADVRAEWLGRALASPSPPALERTIRIERAWARIDGSDPAGAVQHLDRVAASDPTADQLDRVWFGRGILAMRRGDLGPAREWLQRVRPAGPDGHRAGLLLGDILLAERRLDEAAEQVGRILAELDARGRKVEAALAALNLGTIELGRTRLDRAEALYRRVLPVVREAGLLRAAATVVSNLAGVALERGRSEEALGHAEEAHRMAVALGSVHLEALAIGRIGVAHLIGDRAGEAEPRLRRGGAARGPGTGPGGRRVPDLPRIRVVVHRGNRRGRARVPQDPGGGPSGRPLGRAGGPGPGRGAARAAGRGVPVPRPVQSEAGERPIDGRSPRAGAGPADSVGSDCPGRAGPGAVDPREGGLDEAVAAAVLRADPRAG